MTAAIKMVHLLALSIWMGSMAFFVPVALTIFGLSKAAHPIITRRVAGEITGSLFPSYFWIQVISGVLAFLTSIIWNRGPASTTADRVRTGFLLVALGVLAIHSTVVYSKNVQYADQLHQAQDAGDSVQAQAFEQQFGMWHGISMTLNLVTIVLIAIVVCMTATMLKTP